MAFWGGGNLWNTKFSELMCSYAYMGMLRYLPGVGEFYALYCNTVDLFQHCGWHSYPLVGGRRNESEVHGGSLMAYDNFCDMTGAPHISIAEPCPIEGIKILGLSGNVLCECDLPQGRDFYNWAHCVREDMDMIKSTILLYRVCTYQPSALSVSKPRAPSGGCSLPLSYPAQRFHHHTH